MANGEIANGEWWRIGGIGSSLFAIGYFAIPYPLIDRAENGPSVRIEHLDPHAIAVGEERGFRRAEPDRLDRPELGDAGIADATLGDRPAGTTVGIAVGHRS